MADPIPKSADHIQGIQWPKLGVVFVLFFAAALLPRLSLILAGVAYADDWGHSYVSHLESYRPLAALDLWFWQSVIGPDYLIMWEPRVLAALWYSVGITLLVAWLKDLGVPLMLACGAGLGVLLHPAFNELVLWGVLSSLALSTTLCCAGVLLAYRGLTTGVRVAGIALVSIAATGSQLLASFGAACVVIEMAARGIRTVMAERGRDRWLRVALVFAPPVLSIGVLLFMRSVLGYEDFASRSLGVSENLLQSKFYVLSNAYANTFQAPLGQVLGNPAALRSFWPALILPWLGIWLLLRWRGINWIRACLLAALPILVFAAAMAPLLGTTAAPTGFRVIGTALLAMSIALAVAVTPLWDSRKSKSVSIGLMLVAILANVFATMTDASVRTAALKRDAHWLVDATGKLKDNAEAIQLCVWRFDATPAPVSSTRGILVSYNIANLDQYSVWYSPFLGSYLGVQGITARTPRPHESVPECADACAASGNVKLGPLEGEIIETSKVVYLCRDRRFLDQKH